MSGSKKDINLEDMDGIVDIVGISDEVIERYYTRGKVVYDPRKKFSEIGYVRLGHAFKWGFENEAKAYLGIIRPFNNKF